MDRIVVKLGAVLYVCWDLLHLTAGRAFSRLREPDTDCLIPAATPVPGDGRCGHDC